MSDLEIYDYSDHQPVTASESRDLEAHSPVAKTPAIKNNYAITLDLALGVSEDDILEAYGLQYHELQEIKHDPVIINQVAHLQKELAKDGVSFKTKSRLMAEALLDSTWKLIHKEGVSHTVKADLIKSVVRWAKYDTNESVGGGGSQNFQLNIHLGGKD